MIDGYEFKNFKLDYIYEAGKNQGVSFANQLWLDHPIFKSARENILVENDLKEMVLSYSGWHWINKNPVLPFSPASIKQLDKIISPTLIITGEKDIRDFQDIADVLHKNIIQSSKKQIAGAGHMCNMENANAFNSVVEDFLKII